MAALGARAEIRFLSAAQLERMFPGLRNSPYGITSPQTSQYNCIAWAADDSSQWWWPERQAYWPAGVPREVALDAFIEAYATLGYVRCESDEREDGIEKVAIFVNTKSEPTHAARQMRSGMWTSKLGPSFDIAHTLEGVSGILYGTVGAILQRPRRSLSE